MVKVLRAAGGIVAGMLVAFVLVIAVELFSSVVHPLPPDFGETMDEMCAHVERYPAWVLAVVVPLWAGTALAGTWVAGRLGNRVSALVVGGLLVFALLFNLAMLPYPSWFKVSALIAVSLGILGAHILVAISERRRGVKTELSPSQGNSQS